MKVSPERLCPLIVGKAVDELRANADLNSLNRVHDHQAKSSVEDVACPHLVQSGAAPEGVATLPERERVSTEPVVTHAPQACQERSAIRNQAPLQEQVGLLFERERWFRVLHAMPPGKERPATVSMLGRGLAGLLIRTLHGCGATCKSSCRACRVSLACQHYPDVTRIQTGSSHSVCTQTVSLAAGRRLR